MRRLREKVTKQASDLRILREENKQLKRGVRIGGYSGSYGGGYNRSPSGTMVKSSYSQMTRLQKKQATCEEWNKGTCTKTEMNGHCGQVVGRKKHACSKIIGNDPVCWGRHTEVNHQRTLMWALEPNIDLKISRKAFNLKESETKFLFFLASCQHLGRDFKILKVTRSDLPNEVVREVVK